MYRLPEEPRELQTTSPNIGNRIREGVFVTLVLIAALAFFYRDVVFGGHTFLVEGSTKGTMPLSADGTQGPYRYSGPIDIYQYDIGSKSAETEPSGRFMALSYQSGQIPLWNPHQGLGIPFYATGQVGVFDPIRVLFATLIPIPLWSLGMDAQLLLRYFLSGLFTYLFLRSLGAKVLPSLAAGLAYMFSTYFLLYGNMPHVPVELLFPLIILAYHRLAVQRSLGTLIFCAFAILLLLLTDLPEVYPLQFGFGLAWYGFQTVLAVRDSANKWKSVRDMVLRYVLATLLGLMLGAFLVLPFVQFLLSAASLHQPGAVAHYGLTSLRGLFVITRIEFARLALIPLMFSAIGLVLGMKAALDERLRRLFINLLVLVGAAIVALLVSYNAPLFGQLSYLPLLNMVILGKYIQPIVAFLVACAGGIGLDLFLSFELKPSLRKLMFYSMSGLVLVGFLVGIVLIGGGANAPRMKIGISLVFDSAVVLVFLLGFVLKRTADPNKVGLFFIVLVVLEPATLNSFLESRPLRYDPFTVPPFITYLQNQNPPFRIATDQQDILFPNQSTAYQLDDARYQNALDPVRYVTYCKRFLVPPITPNDRLTCSNAFLQLQHYDLHLDLLNVKYILTTHPIPPARTDSEAPFEPAFDSDGIYVFRNPDAFPRAFVVSKAEVVSTINEVFDRLGSKDFDPRRTVLLEETPPDAFMNPSASEDGTQPSAQLISRSDNDVTIQTKLSQPGFLVLSDLYYPGWEVVVDGKSDHLYSADGVLRAVALGPGEHKVEFHFRPAVFFAGLVLASFAILTLLAALIVQRVRH